MKRTRTLVKVAIALMEDPHGRHWGYGLGRASGVRSSTLYPMLTRFLESGWVTDDWEDLVTFTEKRPPRRFYVLTDEGRRQLGALARSETGHPGT